MPNLPLLYNQRILIQAQSCSSISCIDATVLILS